MIKCNVSYKNIVIKFNNSDIFCNSYCIYVNLRREYIYVVVGFFFICNEINKNLNVGKIKKIFNFLISI